MCFFIKKLGKRKQGEVLNIYINKKNFSLKIVKLSDIDFFSMNKKTSPFISLTLRNLKAKIRIEETGYWFLIAEKINKNEGFIDFVLMVDSES